MADKRQVKRSIRQLQRVKTWQLILLLLLTGLIAATFLRLNNIGMIERRTAVFSADERGDTEIIAARLFDLQRYTAAHMNASTGPVDLEGQFKRDTQAAIAQGNEAAGSGANINIKADKTCKQRHGGYSYAYVLCFADELGKYPAADVNKVELPSAGPYRHSFISPVWSADFAGFSLLLCLAILLIIIARLVSLGLLRLLLRRHYKTI